MSERVTAEDIRQKFPSPVSAAKLYLQPGEYCVGGAACLYYVKGQCLEWAINKFPEPSVLARTLMALNPELDQFVAGRFAWNITMDNDMGNFDEAWAALDKALAYKAPGDGR